MVVYRIARTSYIRDLSGAGAKRYGGRWNTKGIALLYTSQYRSLAILEVLVNTGMRNLPKDLSMLKLRLPERNPLPEIKAADLPGNWRSSPAPYRLAEIGSEWITANTELSLSVPSAVVPEEKNILINPNHPAFKKIRIESVSSFSLDSRLLEKAT